jgi:hypothetical protein
MRRLQPLLALVLLALWLPATMHCGLESLGSFAHFAGNLCDDKKACSEDACDLLENGGYMGAVPKITAKPVVFTTVLPLAEPLSGPMRIIPPPAEVEKPPLEFEWGEPPPWQFARRAAMLPGAPQLRLI